MKLYLAVPITSSLVFASIVGSKAETLRRVKSEPAKKPFKDLGMIKKHKNETHSGGHRRAKVEGDCTDLVDGWYDSDGAEFNCEWYSDKQNCQLYGDDFSNLGYTANEACCACGGGNTICSDVEGWHDSDGPEFDCAWYAAKDNCNLYGDQYANSGLTANDACCVCGGEGTATGSGTSGTNSTFQITLMNMGTNTNFDQAFENAKARWEALITNDLKDIPAGESDWFSGNFGTSVNVAVDDVLIGYDVKPIDGFSGTLGMAGPTFVRTDVEGDLSTLSSTIAGVMIFDSADFASMPANDAEIIIMHEMGHVLGVGSLWGFKCGTLCSLGFHSYTCPKANNEYSNLPMSAGNLLLENDGGEGTACGHWEDASFSHSSSSELMTGWFDSGKAQPLSRVTAAALEDLGGYVVDYDAADPYPGTMSVEGGKSTFKVLAPTTSFRLNARVEHPELHALHLS